MSKILLQYIISKQHHKYRRVFPEYDNLCEEYASLGLSPKERMTRRFELFCSLEKPVLLGDEKICFLRTVEKLPDCLTEAEWKDIKSKHFIHELGYMSNLSPDYESAVRDGLMSKYDDADEYGKRTLDAIFSLTDRYRQEAERQGKTELVRILSRVPKYGAETFYEALQSFRIIHYSLWLEGNYHNTVGRFDKYMYPYLKADLDSGRLTQDEAQELLEDFFISFNKDSDLYTGVQQGDNGQSMVLGGIDSDGRSVFNILSEMCLKASRNLMLIDPKINLRVDKDTPIEIFKLGSQLTKAGLGFPQYSNNDVVIEGLMKLGYEERDARDYVVAACWEFIIPGVGADVANIGALSFPKIIDISLHKHLASCDTFESFLVKVKEELKAECDRICSNIKDLWFVPSPFMNIMMRGGIYEGNKYNNFGIHGTGIATAADSLAAIEKHMYHDRNISAEKLITAVDSDFEKENDILPLLRYGSPKMGNNDDAADSKAIELLNCFSDSLKGKVNCRGGIYRAGTGSAMYYLWHASEIGASPDGRRRGEPFGANFSPSLFVKIKGPISVIKSFTKPDLRKTINGGPLTLEFSNSMFSSDESIEKIASFVKAYITMGGHQIQLNAVNSELLRDAQLHPERHGQLVVRVWGWSAYFVELDREYQDHVISRNQYTV